MKKYLALVKTLFLQQMRGANFRLGKKRKSNVVLWIVLAVCFAPMLVGLAVGMFYLGQVVSINSPELSQSVVTLLLVVCQGMVLLFSTASLINNVFCAKDNERLLAMPFTSSQIFCAKLSIVYINEVITTAVMVLALLVPYGIGASMGVGYYLLTILALFVVPLAPLLIETILAIPVSFIVSKLQGKGFAKTLVTALLFVVIFGLYLWGYTSLMGSAFVNGDVSGEDMVRLILEKLQPIANSAKYIVFDFWFAQAMTTSSLGFGIGRLGLSLLTNVALLGLAVLVALPFYVSSLTKSLEHTSSKTKKQSFAAMKQSGLTRQLIVCDLKRIMRQSELGFQILMMPILMPLIVVFLGFVMRLDSGDGTSVIELIKSAQFSSLIPIVVFVYMLLLGCSTNVAGLFPISRERSSFYLMKVIPVPVQKQLNAKLLFSTLIMLLSDVLTGVAIVLMFGIPWFYIPILAAGLALYGYGTTCITMLLDLKKPILEWTSFQASLKNSANALLAMLCSFACVVAVGGVSAIFYLWYINIGMTNVLPLVLLWVSVFVVGGVFALVTHKILADNGERYFEQIGN